MGGGQEQGTEQLAQGPALFLRVGMNRILILCSGNYYRSRFAEEVFNFRARAVYSNWSADSRGLRLNPNNVGPIADHSLTVMFISFTAGVLIVWPMRSTSTSTEKLVDFPFRFATSAAFVSPS